jgi:hypothetical protein
MSVFGFFERQWRGKMQEAVIYVAWDETGEYAADIDEDEAISRLDGDLKRVLTLKLSLLQPRKIEMHLDVQDDGGMPMVRSK